MSYRDEILDFVIAGAHKGGTTQLAAMLSQVNGVTIEPRENPAFESPNFEAGAVQALGERMRASLEEGRIRGIKRASYLADSEVPGRIDASSPHARVIVILRDPVQRAISAYLHRVQYGHISLMSVSDAMRRILEGDDLGSPRTQEILTWGKYSELLPIWREVFGKRLLVVGNSDLRADPMNTLEMVTGHLGVECRVLGALPESANSGVRSMAELAYRRRMHRALKTISSDTNHVNRRTRNPLRLSFGVAMRRMAKRENRRAVQKDPDFLLSPEIQKDLADYFHADVEYVRQNFNVEI